MDCGCTIQFTGNDLAPNPVEVETVNIVYCPLHAAALEMRITLRKIRIAVTDYDASQDWILGIIETASIDLELEIVAAKGE